MVPELASKEVFCGGVGYDILCIIIGDVPRCATPDTMKPSNSPTARPQEAAGYPLPAPIADYLRQEITALELAGLLDEHLHDMVGWITASGEAWTEDQNSAYHHIRRLRDLFVELSNAQPAKP